MKVMKLVAALLSCGLVYLLAVSPALAQGLVRVDPVPGGQEVAPGSRPDPGVAEKAAFIAQQDDGEVDVFYSLGSTTAEFAMLFENIGGPEVTLGSIDVCMHQTGADPKIRYEVVVWAADGPAGAPGTELTHAAAIATGVGAGPTFDTTTLDYPLTTQDVYLGFRYNPVVDPDFKFCGDRDGTTVYPGFYRFDETGSWTNIVAGFDPSYNALMVRGFLSTPGVFAENLLLPYFLVDKNDPNGTTTLFAIRNLTDSSVSGQVEYFTTAGVSQRVDGLMLDAHDTVTVNLRNVAGLAADGGGFARGYVELTTAGNPDMTPVLAGDYFQVDVGNDFATGERLVRQIQLCDHPSIRFLEFPLAGSGTRLTVWMSNPRGIGGGAPPSFTVQAYDEDGNAVGSEILVFSTENAREFDASFFSDLDFGTLRFDFSNSFGGTVFAESSVQGRFSVGVTSQCDEFP